MNNIDLNILLVLAVSIIFLSLWLASESGIEHGETIKTVLESF